jgi:dTMP kinase
VVVLADRYSYSGVAYSVAQGLPAEWCKGTEAGLPAPDLVVFLKLSPAAAAQRAGYGEERYANVETQTKVRTPGARPWWPEGSNMNPASHAANRRGQECSSEGTVFESRSQSRCLGICVGAEMCLTTVILVP